MKKEYLILFALVLILSAYLFLHKENKNHYTLPEIQKIDTGKITGIIITKGQDVIPFTKKGKTWVLTDKEYPASSSSVEDMLDVLKSFKLSALVSRNGNLARYNLDTENKIQVKILQGKKEVFEFNIGKTAPTYNHTFVSLKDDNNIYHANGSFRSDFDKSEDDFRDKKILEFKEDTIQKITLEKKGLSKILTAKKGKEKTSLSWQSEDGTPADKKAVSNLLSSLSFLKCDNYLKDSEKEKLEKEKPLCRIVLENKEKFELKLFKTNKEDTITGLSSMNQYAFALSEFNAKGIVSDIEKLLGIAKKEKKKE